MFDGKLLRPQKFIAAIELLYDEAFAGVLGVADADFDRILNRLFGHEGLIFSETHDLDLDWTRQANLARYLNEVGDKAKVTNCGGTEKIRETIFNAMLPLSILRLCNASGRIRLKLTNLRYDNFFQAFTINTHALVAEVYYGRNVDAGTQDALLALIESESKHAYDPFQLHNGHDFCALLGLSLRNSLGARRDPQTYGSEVATHLRLAFSDDCFRRSPIFAEIVGWEKRNVPYLVLDYRFH